MSTEENEAAIRRWLEEGWTKGKLAVADELIDAGFVVHGAGGQAVPTGPEGVKQLVSAWRTGFPDGRMSVDDMIGEGDKVAIRMTWRGTHKGVFYGIAAQAGGSCNVDRHRPGGKREDRRRVGRGNNARAVPADRRD